MKSQFSSNYFFLFLRVSQCYFCMNILQICLALTIVIGLVVGWSEIVSLIQIWIAFFFSLDLTIKYFSQESIFWKKLQNKIDIIIFIVICLSITADLTISERIHHENSLLGVLMLIIRYLLQLYRIASLIKTSTELRQQNGSSKIDIKEEVEGQSIIQE